MPSIVVDEDTSCEKNDLCKDVFNGCKDAARIPLFVAAFNGVDDVVFFLLLFNINRPPNGEREGRAVVVVAAVVGFVVDDDDDDDDDVGTGTGLELEPVGTRTGGTGTRTGTTPTTPGVRLTGPAATPAGRTSMLVLVVETRRAATASII